MAAPAEAPPPLAAAPPAPAPAPAPPPDWSGRVLFLVVASGADPGALDERRPAGPRYTRDSLRALLQLLGCKPRLAAKVAAAVFGGVEAAVAAARGARGGAPGFRVHPHRNGKVGVSLARPDFAALVSTCAARYALKISPASDELRVACSLCERRRCVIVLLCGTSGSGKSTLASILANRLGITTVISTDSIRHMLRSFSSREAAPLLWASTYQAGECVRSGPSEAPLSEGERVLCGYKAQCELLAEQLELLVAGCEARRQSLIVEGVHLNVSLVLPLMARHACVLPFLVHIGSEAKHVERMAVRAKYMTLDPRANRYVRYIGAIRLIQEYLARKADKAGLPRVDNTNPDRSVGVIHLTIMACLRRMAKGESVLDHASGTARLLAAEYAAVLEHLSGEEERAEAVAAAAAAGAGGAALAAAAARGGPGAGAGAGAGSSSGTGLLRGAAADAGPSCSSSKAPLASVAAAAAAAAVAGRPDGGSAAGPSSPPQQRQQPAVDATLDVVPPPVLPPLDTTAWRARHSGGGLSAALAAEPAAGGSSSAAAGAAANGPGGDGSDSPSDLLLWSAEGPVLRWERLLQSSRLSPGDETGSPVSPLAAAGLTMRVPRGASHLAPFATTAGPADGAGGSDDVSATAAAAARSGGADGAGPAASDARADAGGARDARAGWDSDEALVSSGEELDELGKLGSSDNEAERFTQEYGYGYGSVAESTTADEHDDDDPDPAPGLRAWHGGMARALWPPPASARAHDVLATLAGHAPHAAPPTARRRPVSAGAEGGGPAGLPPHVGGARGFRRSTSAVARAAGARGAAGGRRWSGAASADGDAAQAIEASPRRRSVEVLSQLIGDDDGAAAQDEQLVPWWQIKPKQSAPPRRTLMHPPGEVARFVADQAIYSNRVASGRSTPLGSELDLPQVEPYFCYLLTAAQLAVYAAGTWLAVSQGPDAGEAWALTLALQPDAVLGSGEAWRLGTSLLLHGGLTHLAVDTFLLSAMGPGIEALLGHGTFVLTYVLAGLAGGATVLLLGDGAVPVACASAASVGLVGAMLGFELRNTAVVRESLASRRSQADNGRTGGELLRKPLGAVGLVGLLLLLGVLHGSLIDNAAHAGGLVAGTGLGWLLGPHFSLIREVQIPPGSMAVPEDAPEMVVVLDKRSTLDRLLGGAAAAGAVAGLVALAGAAHALAGPAAPRAAAAAHRDLWSRALAGAGRRRGRTQETRDSEIVSSGAQGCADASSAGAHAAAAAPPARPAHVAQHRPARAASKRAAGQRRRRGARAADGGGVGGAGAPAELRARHRVRGGGRAAAARALEYPGTSPRGGHHAHAHHHPSVDIPASVTKSPGPASSVHTRSPVAKAAAAALQAAAGGGGGGGGAGGPAASSGGVSHRTSISTPAAAAAAGLNGHAAPHHHHHGKPGPPGGADKARHARVMLARRLAVWLTLAAGAALVLGALVPAAEVGPPAAPADVALDLGRYYFNPSIVRHRGLYLSTARTAHMKRIDRTNWWFNEAYVCMSTRHDFVPATCRKFDPWQGRFQECLWGSERKVADVDTQGVEDPKLFVWPGRGVYAVFGRKPEALGASPYCKDPIFVQFVVQVVADGPDDEWSLRRPTELKPGAFAAQLYGARLGSGSIKEKNWMPFVWGDQLMTVHSVTPHRVFRVNASGVAVQQWVTSSPSLFGPFKDEDIHGGPPLALVPGELAGGGVPYYLGVFHFFQTFGEGAGKVKAYHHYAYRVEAAPPFRVCGVSREIGLVTRKRPANKKASDWTHQRIWKDTSQTAYISGLFIDGSTVHMSYGSSDIDARLLSMSVADMEALFDGSPWDCSASAVLDDGSGEPLPPKLQAAGVAAAISGAVLPEAGAAVRHHRHRRAHHRDRKASRRVLDGGGALQRQPQPLAQQQPAAQQPAQQQPAQQAAQPQQAQAAPASGARR
ncbi:LPA1 [Scenedesmus sp. PABB004]|nr:LPA1 [Scenedesmus sp. PABB004]